MKQFSRNLTVYLVTIFVSFIFTFQFFAGSNIDALKNSYPHWNLDDKTQLEKVEKIDAFIEKNKDKGYLAVFDWDGTLYCEKIPMKELSAPENIYGGQAGFYIWGAFNSDKFDSFKLFPVFNTQSGNFKEDVLQKVKVVESRLFDGMQNEALPPSMPGKPYLVYNADEYSKFSLGTTILLLGMTPFELQMSESKYFEAYSPAKYAFLPMMDILQKMCDSKYNVWIITGSSPYFVANMLSYLQQNVSYTSSRNYNFSNIIASKDNNYDPSQSHIAGNGTKLTKNGTFSAVYEDSFLVNDFINNSGLLYVTDKQGKYLVIANLESKFKTNAAFVAGNTDGDLFDTSYVLEESKLSPDTLAICVAPPETSKIYQYLQKFPAKSVILTTDEAYPQGLK
ncbi:MAG TPA: hypothetical protein DD381_08665 [Lentisphaeria bacterium]|nr:MAG: hypothetical protein A2X47_08180 [Lentisphaerae bacterium GWF2_38_69]HBM16395.1 hypothetical protein [Lentisphaeria bacterium]